MAARKLSEREKEALIASAYRGAGFLDAKLGISWRRRIDPERLALERGRACILGQLYGDYREGIEQTGIADQPGVTGRTYGFNGGDVHEFKVLNKVWRKILVQ